jgi:hypothetical protein
MLRFEEINDMYTTQQPILDHIQLERIKAVYIDPNYEA